MDKLTKCIESIINKLKQLRGLEKNIEQPVKIVESSKKEEIEGYLITTEGEKSLLLIQESSKYWKTKWFDNSLFIYKSPITPLNEIFKTK